MTVRTRATVSAAAIALALVAQPLDAQAALSSTLGSAAQAQYNAPSVAAPSFGSLGTGSSGPAPATPAPEPPQSGVEAASVSGTSPAPPTDGRGVRPTGPGRNLTNVDDPSSAAPSAYTAAADERNPINRTSSLAFTGYNAAAICALGVTLLLAGAVVRRKASA